MIEINPQAAVKIPRPSFFGRNRIFYWVLVGLIAAVACGIRFVNLTNPPLDFNSTRQLHSALIARGMYYQNLSTATEAQRQIAVQQWKGEGLIEPQILETITAFSYRIAGGAYLWIARIYSILLWMLGGLGIFLLARALTGDDGALIAMTFFLFDPFGVVASRSFQPDPLLVAMIPWALWAQYRWYLKPTWRWSVIAGLLTGLTIYVKGTGLFFVLPSFAGMVLVGVGLKQALRSLRFWLVAALSVLPYALYTFYGTYVLHLLQDQLALRFFPKMLIDPVFYLQWMGPIKSAVGYGAFMLALLGLLLFSDKAKRGLVIGAWFGYLVYGMVFPYHITTHDYYQLPLIPLVALGLAGAAQPIFARLVEYSQKKSLLWVGAATFVLVFALTITGWDSIVTLKRDDYRNEVTFWERMGQRLAGQGPVIGLTHDYGYRLGYWGWTPIANWMTSADFNLQSLAGNTYDMKSLFEQSIQGKNLFVVTLLGEFDSQPALKAMLNDHYPIWAQAGDYIIYDLRKPK